MKFRILIFFLLATVGTAYAASKMAISENQEQVDTPSDKAQIIFVRVHGGFGGAPIFDVTTGEPQFIGILKRNNKLAYFVEPGNYTFMVIAEAADFMAANVVGGKTYYVFACPGGGGWKHGWHLYPMRSDSEGLCQIPSKTLQKWFAKSKYVENTETSIQWAKAQHDSIVSKQIKYWEKWEAMPNEEIAERTLNASDGN